MNEDEPESAITGDGAPRATSKTPLEMPTPTPLLTAHQTAEILNVSLRTLAYWRKAGIGPAHTWIGSNLRYPWVAIVAYIVAKQVG